MQAKREQERSKGDKKALPDIREYIKPAGMMETRYMRLLSSLCAQTYVMHKLTVRLVERVSCTCRIDDQHTSHHLRGRLPHCIVIGHVPLPVVVQQLHQWSNAVCNLHVLLFHPIAA